jgi:hypothetical protein
VAEDGVRVEKKRRNVWDGGKKVFADLGIWWDLAGWMDPARHSSYYLDGYLAWTGLDGQDGPKVDQIRENHDLPKSAYIPPSVYILDVLLGEKNDRHGCVHLISSIHTHLVSRRKEEKLQANKTPLFSCPASCSSQVRWTHQKTKIG